MTSQQQAPLHAWSQATNKKIHHLNTLTPITTTTNNTDSATTIHTTTFISRDESYNLIESSLPLLPLTSIGSDDFLRHYALTLEKLSFQAHAHASSQNDDCYVLNDLLLHDKIPTLVKMLLTLETWRCDIFGGNSLMERCATNGNTLRCAFTLHVERSLLGLLNLVFYRREGCDGMDGDVAIGLVDYCARCMTALAIPLSQNPILQRQKNPLDAKALAKYLTTRTALQDLTDTLQDTTFQIYLSATTLARYLCEHITLLPLSAQTRILDTHDYLTLFIPLVDEPPWTRRRRLNDEVIWEKYINNTWEKISTENLLLITQMEAQVWIGLHQLTSHNICRERYPLTTYRKERLLKLRKYLNDTLLDQLPILADVREYMDRLALMEVPDHATGGGTLLLQQVSVLKEEVSGGRRRTEEEWRVVAEECFERIFKGVTDREDGMLRKISDLYALDGIEEVMGEVTTMMQGGEMGEEGEEIDVGEEGDARVVEFVTLDVSDSKATTTTTSSSSSVTLTMNVDDNSINTTTTPQGPFQRLKLIIDDTNPNVLTVSHNASLSATISFRDSTTTSVMCLHLDLPLPNAIQDQISSTTIDNNNNAMMSDVDTSSLPTVQWRQLGRVTDGLVIQLGFKKLEKGFVVSRRDKDGGEEEKSCCCYKLHQAYLSQQL